MDGWMKRGGRAGAESVSIRAGVVDALRCAQSIHQVYHFYEFFFLAFSLASSATVVAWRALALKVDFHRQKSLSIESETIL